MKTPFPIDIPRRLILAALLLIVLQEACVSSRNSKTFIGGFPEKQYEFMESISYNFNRDYFHTFRFLKWAGTEWGINLENKMFVWLRHPDNLTRTFNTLELLGLENFVSRTQYHQNIFDDDYWDYDWNGKSLDQICRSMLASYDSKMETEPYYEQFWARRRAEGNDSATLVILQRVNRYYQNPVPRLSMEESDYDTLMYRLLDYDIKMKQADSLEGRKIIVNYFNYLRQVQLEHSAYNLIFEVESFENLSINRDSLLLKLNFDTIPEETYWTIRNEAQWIKTYRDNGP